MFTSRQTRGQFYASCLVCLASCWAPWSALAAQEAAGTPQAAASSAAAESEAELQIGLLHERNGRFADAAGALAKAIAGGSAQTRRAALQALDRVNLAREEVEAELQLRLGEMYEREGRWTEAEAAYVEAIEKGPPGRKAEILQRLRQVIERREDFRHTLLFPVFGTMATSAITVALVLSLVVVGRLPLRALGRRRGRGHLAISDFAHTSGSRTIGSTFPAVLGAMHERMTMHFRRRGPFSDRALPAVVESQSATIAAIVATVSAPAAPILNAFTAALHQPAFRLSGWVESAGSRVMVMARLEHNGTTVDRWIRVFPVRGWFVGEQDLAYEILLRLKEYVDAIEA